MVLQLDWPADKRTMSEDQQRSAGGAGSGRVGSSKVEDVCVGDQGISRGQRVGQ